MPPPGPRWVIWGQLRPYSETEGASSTPRSRPYPTPSPPDSRSDPARSELHCALRAHDQSAALPFWQRGSTGSARQRIGVREARTRLASSPPSAAAGSAARNGCRAHSTAVAPAGRFERPSGIPHAAPSYPGHAATFPTSWPSRGLPCARGPRPLHGSRAQAVRPATFRRHHQ